MAHEQRSLGNVTFSSPRLLQSFRAGPRFGRPPIFFERLPPRLARLAGSPKWLPAVALSPGMARPDRTIREPMRSTASWAGVACRAAEAEFCPRVDRPGGGRLIRWMIRLLSRTALKALVAVLAYSMAPPASAMVGGAPAAEDG